MRGGVASPGIATVESLQLAIEAVPTSVFVVEPTGKIVLVNQELERQFGYAPGELVGQSVDLLVPEKYLPLHLADPEARQLHNRELIGCRKDGSEFPIQVGLNPIKTAEGNLVLATVTDATTDDRQQANVNRVAHEDWRELERLVSDLSSQFVSLGPDEIDQAIRDALARTCRVLGLDSGRLLRIGLDGGGSPVIGWTADAISTASTPVREGLPEVLATIPADQVLLFSTLDEIPSEIDRNAYRQAGIKSGMLVPLSVEGRITGGLELCTMRTERRWTPELVTRLTVIASVFCQVLARQQRDEALRKALMDVQRLKDQLQAENSYLRNEVREWQGPTRIVGQSAGVRHVLEQIEQVAATDSTVLLIGETGTGKELFATHIHEMSARNSRAMVRVNCAAIPATLIESELFGREKGAFTGSLARQIGRFELADRSTIFLDEIGDLPAEVQVKLLRVLEERQIERLGNPRPIFVDVRIIAATHRNLEQRIAEGAFREDLYYRLNVFPIRVPPLRERVEDIPLLVWRFVDEFSKAFGKRVESIGKESLAALQQYPWPGNIRELRNVVERAMIVATTPRLTITIPHGAAATTRRSPKLVDVEKEHIRSVLESTGWRIRGGGGAAERLGMKPTTLETRMAKLGLKRPSN